MASGWDFLAGFAGSLGGSLQAREAQKEKERLAKLEEDALMKRQMFLAEYKASIDEKNSQAEYERTKNDVTAQFTDPETGSVYGRTKGGGTVPLHETSEEYRQSLRDKTASDIEYKKAQRESAQARAERARRPAVAKPEKAKEPKPDPILKEARAAYLAEVARLRGERVEEADIPKIAKQNLAGVYGEDTLRNAIGGKPGASKNNPIPAQSLSSEPPPGTWVQLPNGRVIQTGS